MIYSFLGISLSGFGIRVTLVSKNEAGSGHASSVFWKTFWKIGGNSLNILIEFTSCFVGFFKLLISCFYSLQVCSDFLFLKAVLILFIFLGICLFHWSYLACWHMFILFPILLFTCIRLAVVYPFSFLIFIIWLIIILVSLTDLCQFCWFSQGISFCFLGGFFSVVFLYFCLFPLYSFMIFFLFALGLVCSSLLYFLKVKVVFIWVFLTKVFTDTKFSLSSTFIASHEFRYVVFSFISKYVLIFFMTSLTHCFS